MDASPRIVVDYRIGGSADAAKAVADAIAYEQSVELPRALITDPKIRENVVGQVESVVPIESDWYTVKLSYDAALGDPHLSALLNLIYGNVSIYDDVRLTNVALPDTLLKRYPGPRMGISGVRALTGVHGRPLLATALKPNGASTGELADLAGQFALGGGDLVKDDQNLVDDFDVFKERVTACAEAVRRANLQTGRRCLYFPHVAGSSFELRRSMELVKELGLSGILACPLITGMDTLRTLCEELELMLMAHPSMSGSFTGGTRRGIDHGVLLGTLFRLTGADISIFPNAGGRFSFSREACQDIADRLREPLGNLRPAWPSPGGGMTYSNLSDMCAQYGEDCVLLVGGALLAHDKDRTRGTQSFLAHIQECFPAHRHETPGSPGTTHTSSVQTRRLAALPNFEWHTRPSSPYKDAVDSSYRGVRRVELVGKYGERTHTDLRYFEIEPGGYSSREFHQHTHIVIGARGTGVLILGDERLTLSRDDVAWIEPLEVHQLHNETPEPFGFYCIVDHDRDRPVRIQNSHDSE
jgi:ribulose-bisphosphate carboxylase large chain